MAFCNPLPPIRRLAAALWRHSRVLAFLCSFFASLFAFTAPVMAQGIILLRDTETERALRSYEDPLLIAGGLQPAAVKLYLVNDNSVNAFVAEGQNMFIFTGIIMFAKNAGELKGVMAHETGHMVAGHLSRSSDAIQKATIPMLLSMIVGIAAIAAGAGQAGMLILMSGQGLAQAQFNAFSRVQEATADQIAIKLLDKTHQSSRGLLATFTRLADEEARADRMDRYASDHPMGRERVANLETQVEASPYKDVPEDPAVEHQYEMLQAKLIGYVQPIQAVFNHFPLTDTSKPARYARAMAYSRKPDLPKALAEINSLIKDEPNNPYFYEVLGQIYVSMAKPQLGVVAYQRSVDLMPDAPQLRVALAAAQLATENRRWPSRRWPICACRCRSRTTTRSPGTRRRRPTARSATSRWPIWRRRSAITRWARWDRRRNSRYGRATAWYKARRTGSAPTTSSPSPCRRRANSVEGSTMTPQWKIAALGALGGAAIAVAVVFASAALGVLPQRAAPLDVKQVRAYLLGNPYLLVEVNQRLENDQAAAADAEQQAAFRAIGLKAFFDPKVAFVTGPTDAKATIVEFFDYNCVHCRNTFPALEKYYEAHRNDTRFAFIDYPIFGKLSEAAARAAIAARRQPDKYIPFTFALMSEKSAIDDDLILANARKAGLDVPRLLADMKDPAVEQTLVAAHVLARRLKVTGTPTFIFNGRVRPGELSYDTLRDVMAGKAI